MTKFLILRCEDCHSIEIRTEDEDRMNTRKCSRISAVPEDKYMEYCNGKLTPLFEISAPALSEIGKL